MPGVPILMSDIPKDYKQTALHKLLNPHTNGGTIDVEECKAFIDAADQTALNQQDQAGLTALHWCAKYKNLDFDNNDAKKHVAKLLLAKGARTDIYDNHGATVMHMAAMSEDWSGGIVADMVAAGAKIDEPEPYFGNTAMHWAACSGLPEIIKPLLSAPAAKDALAMKNKEGKTPLEIAEGLKAGNQWNPYPYKSSAEVIDEIKAFLKSKAS